MYHSNLFILDGLSAMVNPRAILKLRPIIDKEKKFSIKCPDHPTIFLNHYCMNCNEGPLCQACSKTEIESEHKRLGHKILQVHKTTHMNAVKVEDVGEYTEGSDIHQLRNNGNMVLLIGRRGNPTAEDNPANQHCVKCKHDFKFLKGKEQPNAKYCSIQCKASSMRVSKHPRKAHPRRAPFF